MDHPPHLATRAFYPTTLRFPDVDADILAREAADEPQAAGAWQSFLRRKLRVIAGDVSAARGSPER